MLKKLIRNEKGLTLIELLAVIVILGIIAAIAIPSIGGLIDNSKKDAHVANAQQMINAAKIAVTADKDLIPANGKAKTISLKYLEDKGYLETIKDPDGKGYTKANNGGVSADLDITGTPVDGTITNEPSGDSYVVIINDNTKLYYRVKLVNRERGVQTGGTDGAAGKAVNEENLKRSEVR
ncbi:prepilin-type N-terminal cleavage/methylation domain-containing protein [Anoxybacillus flavithermus]|uniref:prepilin-type N-terminal cleavage/methylation domain-containing protein n=1 Tax=Anoxybacillus flavithermus TaxID=33934 RepID=UPI0018667E7E|nr:prepilin-type N-terminal cleavage/methylation domain-containing protein [Anoxybacillus flavithermus]MBE2911930.1 prepilin-type N-terminal cleavage/methylation domain-containing protein [Anoxybacillus flavithermus]